MTIAITLREAVEEDFDFLFHLHCEALKQYIELTWGWDEEWQKAYFTERFELTDKRIIRYGSTDIGCIAVHDQADYIFLAYIALLPDFQGMGIGTRLIQGQLRRAKELSLPVILRVLKANPARALYERLGFSVKEASSTHYLMEARPSSRSA